MHTPGMCLYRAYPQSPYNPVRRRKKQLEQENRQAKRSHRDVMADLHVKAAREVYKRACLEARYNLNVSAWRNFIQQSCGYTKQANIRWKADNFSSQLDMNDTEFQQKRLSSCATHLQDAAAE